ncbi:MAG: tetratricopeptide repeat protein, partial [Candidatus Gracilibacteria bacterium]
KLALVQSNLDLNQIAEAKELVWQLDRANFQVKYYTGLILVLYKEFDQAKEFFTAIIATDSTAPDEIKKNTQQILDRYQTFGYYSEAEKIFLQTMLAKTLTEIDQHYLAIPLLFDIISQKNNYRDAWIVLGYAYLNTDQLPETIDAFSQAEALDPEKPETLFFLGLAYQKSAKPDKAIYYIEKADNAGFEPKDEINLRLGQLYTDQKDYEKAAQKFEQIIDSNPDNIDAFVQLVSLYLDDLNQPEKALAASNKAIQYHNKDAISYNLKAWALTALGRADEAKKHLEKADSLGGSDLNSALIKEKITQLNLQITNPPLKGPSSSPSSFPFSEPPSAVS